MHKVIRFAIALANHVLHGLPDVSDEVYARRLAVCRGCREHFDPATVTCTHERCGCDLTVKARWAEQACPIGKWPAEVGPGPAAPPGVPPPPCGGCPGTP